MPTYGPFYPSVVGNVAGAGNAWTNEADAEGPSGSGATNSDPSPSQTLVAQDIVDASGNPPDITDTDTIVGFTCAVSVASTQDSGEKWVADDVAAFNLAGTGEGSNLANGTHWPESEAALAYGSSSSLSGISSSITPAEVNAQDLQFWYSANASNDFSEICTVYTFEIFVFTTAGPAEVEIAAVNVGTQAAVSGLVAGNRLPFIVGTACSMASRF